MNQKANGGEEIHGEQLPPGGEEIRRKVGVKK
jgi:hypothetical protein